MSLPCASLLGPTLPKVLLCASTLVAPPTHVASTNSSHIVRSGTADAVWITTEGIAPRAPVPGVATRAHACVSPVRMRGGAAALIPASPTRAGASAPLPVPSTLGGTPFNVVTTGAKFAGLTQTSWLPPDPNLAVGPSHVVDLVNEEIAFYDKTGILQFLQITNSNGSPGFWSPVGASNNVFDAKVTYDQYANRFVMVGLEVTATDAYLDLGISDDSDPNGTWYLYRTLATTDVGGVPFWLDYPGLAIDKRGIYVTANLFDLPTSSAFGGVIFRVFDKAPLLAGSTAVFTDVVDPNVYSVQGVHNFGSASAPLFVSENGSPLVEIHSIQDPLTAPVVVTSDVVVPAFNYPTVLVPQAGTTNGLDPLDGRMINGAFRAGRLWFAHAIDVGGKNVARWYQVALNGWPAANVPSLVQSGEIDPGNDSMGAPIHTWFPTIAVNKCRGVGVVVARSSPNEFAGTYVTGRQNFDPAGTMNPLVPLHIGIAGYDRFRWGDFFGIAVDPIDDWTFWATGQDATSSATWETWIGSFDVGLRPCHHPLSR